MSRATTIFFPPGRPQRFRTELAVGIHHEIPVMHVTCPRKQGMEGDARTSVLQTQDCPLGMTSHYLRTLVG